MARAILTLPATARRGETVEVRALIAHPMETGQRRDDAGAIVPRDIVTRFTCRYGGETVFAADLFPAVAAQPLLAFCFVATASGPVECTWEGDRGFAQTERATLTVA